MKSLQNAVTYNHASSIKLQDVISPEDKLTRLASLIDWDLLSNEYQHKFRQDNSPLPRLLFGLLYLQAKECIGPDELVKRWKKSPEWQYFCGEEVLKDEFPLHPSQLSIWRREIGVNGFKLMCAALAPSLPVVH